MLRFGWLLCLLATSALGCGSSDDSQEPCGPDDFDGVNGGKYTFQVTVTDSEFSPNIVKTQNVSHVTLILTNAGTRPHGFSIDCLPTPNDRGCPAESCFPPASMVASVDPGSNQTVEFDVPNPEGIHTFRSPVAGDTLTGQFIVQ